MDSFNSNTGRTNDFQPQSSDLQTANGGLQNGYQTQSTSNWAILNDENVQISDPSPGITVPQKVSTSTVSNNSPHVGVSWIPIIVATVLIVVAIEFVLRRREKSRSPDSILVNDKGQSRNIKPEVTSKKSSKRAKHKRNKH